MDNLKITAYLASPVVIWGLIHFDGILSAAKILKDEGFAGIEKREAEMREKEPDFIELPIAIWRENIYCASAGFYNKRAEGIATYHKKWDEQHDDLVDFRGKRKRIRVGTGFYKSFSLKNRYISTDKMIFFVKGNKAAIEELLHYIPAIGKRRAEGYGIVREWKIEKIEDDRSIQFKGQIMRAIPTRLARELPQAPKAMRLAQVTYRPPYFYRRWAEKCMIPADEDLSYAGE